MALDRFNRPLARLGKRFGTCREAVVAWKRADVNVLLELTQAAFDAEGAMHGEAGVHRAGPVIAFLKIRLRDGDDLIAAAA